MPAHERIAAILGISLAVWMASLDTAIVNTALPAISTQLGSTPADVIARSASQKRRMLKRRAPWCAHLGTAQPRSGSHGRATRWSMGIWVSWALAGILRYS